MRGIFHWIMKIKRVIGRRDQSLMTLIFCLFWPLSHRHDLMIFCFHIFCFMFINILITPFSLRFPWNKNTSTVLFFSLSWLLLLAVLQERSILILLPTRNPIRILPKTARPLLPLWHSKMKTGGSVFRKKANGPQEMLL